jgi:uncharacterized membrane protein (UPF0182 family)
MCIGVAVAIIAVSLVSLGAVNGCDVDWAWLSAIGYVGIFWTIFVTKAVLFVAIFAVFDLLLWANGTVALLAPYIEAALARKPRVPPVDDAAIPRVEALGRKAASPIPVGGARGGAISIPAADPLVA